MGRRVDFPSLDALAAVYKPGYVRYREGNGNTYPGRIVGYVWCFPRHRGEPDVPVLVIETVNRTIGLCYPEDIVAMAE
jgi:hypothetical protein